MITKKCDNFTLNIELQMKKPDNQEFKHNAANLGLQYGADFELEYAQSTEREYPIGILQFIKPTQIVGNPLGDSKKNIYIDKNNAQGNTLENYLFGTPDLNISYDGTFVTGHLTCVREKSRSIIRDTPRELIGYELDASNTLRLRVAPKMVFYDFFVEIRNGYCFIYPYGVTFEISVEQKRNGNMYLNEYNLNTLELKRANFNDLRLDTFLKNINMISYKVI